MTRGSLVLLAVASSIGAIALNIATPAAGQPQAVASQLGKEERAALLALSSAIETRDYPRAAAALPGAQASARTGYARYLASSLQLRLGIETGNVALQSSAIDSMLTSGAAPASELPALYKSKAALAQTYNKFEAADAAFARYIELAPNDVDAVLALAQVKVDRKKPQDAVAIIERAIAMRTAAGQPAPESWYKRGLDLALANRLAPQTLGFSRALVLSHPSAINWRDTVYIYRDTARPDLQAEIDAWRLMRSARALAGERDYLQFAQALSTAGLAAESKAVLDEGAAARMIDAGTPGYKTLLASMTKRAATDRAGLARKETAALAAAGGADALAAADLLLGHGEYARAATLYRAALQKGGVDASLASHRLGIALAMAGQRSEAQTALAAVNGSRSALASLWLVWLGQRA